MRSRLFLAPAVAIAVALLAFALPSTGDAPAASTKKLSGTVGPGFTIKLKSKGKNVRRVRPGRYRITVRDRSDIHNFRLRGRGVNRAITSVDFEGRKTRTVRLRKGRYRFICDPHSDFMRGSFRVR